MAEAIGLIASVIQVAATGLKLSQTLYQYAEGVATADRRIKDIAKEIQLTSFVIDELGSIFKQDETSTLMSNNAVRTANETMKECSAVFADIESTLAKSRKGKMGRLMLPFRDNKIELLRNHIDKLKSTLQLLMQVLTHAHLVSSKQLDREAEARQRDEIRQLLENKKRSNIRYEESLRNLSISDDSTAIDDDQDWAERSDGMRSNEDFAVTVFDIGSTMTTDTLGQCVQHIQRLLASVETLQQALSKQKAGDDHSQHHQSLVGSYLQAREHLDGVLLGSSKPSKVSGLAVNTASSWLAGPEEVESNHQTIDIESHRGVKTILRRPRERRKSSEGSELCNEPVCASPSDSYWIQTERSSTRRSYASYSGRDNLGIPKIPEIPQVLVETGRPRRAAAPTFGSEELPRPAPAAMVPPRSNSETVNFYDDVEMVGNLPQIVTPYKRKCLAQPRPRTVGFVGLYADASHTRWNSLSEPTISSENVVASPTAQEHGGNSTTYSGLSQGNVSTWPVQGPTTPNSAMADPSHPPDYSPVSPSFSPTSPGYSPVSPGYSPVSPGYSPASYNADARDTDTPRGEHNSNRRFLDLEAEVSEDDDDDDDNNNNTDFENEDIQLPDMYHDNEALAMYTADAEISEINNNNVEPPETDEVEQLLRDWTTVYPALHT